jgi:hypothetical protein
VYLMSCAEIVLIGRQNKLPRNLNTILCAFLFFSIY